MIPCHAESSSRPTSTRHIENVHGIADTTTCSRATHQQSSPAAQSAPFLATHAPHTSTSHHLAISIKSQNKSTYEPFEMPPANTANPWFGSDVAARTPLATLRAAVAQRPLVTLKMSTALLRSPAHAQRISIRPQQLKALPFLATHAPHTSTSHHLAISKNVKSNQHAYRPRIRPILGSAVTSLQDDTLPR